MRINKYISIEKIPKSSQILTNVLSAITDGSHQKNKKHKKFPFSHWSIFIMIYLNQSLILNSSISNMNNNSGFQELVFLPILHFPPFDRALWKLKELP